MEPFVRFRSKPGADPAPREAAPFMVPARFGTEDVLLAPKFAAELRARQQASRRARPQGSEPEVTS